MPARDPAFHTRLKLVRTERGLSRRELADAVGVHYQTIGNIERGEYSPSLDVVLRISAYLELPVEALFSLEPFGRLDADALSRRDETRGDPT